MWPKSYKDYPEDETLKKSQVEPGAGISGCEMHELNGWGNRLHRPPRRQRGIFYHLIEKLFNIGS